MGLSQEQSNKHGHCAEREHLCFTKVLAQSSSIAAGAIFGRVQNLTLPLQS